MVAFALALLMGTAVYFRIWARQSSDPSFTADDREELRCAPKSYPPSFSFYSATSPDLLKSYYAVLNGKGMNQINLCSNF
jgi:hypothetical protein